MELQSSKYGCYLFYVIKMTMASHLAKVFNKSENPFKRDFGSNETCQSIEEIRSGI